MLKKEAVRDGAGRVVAFVESGFSGSYDFIVQDKDGRVLGTTSSRFGTTRGSGGGLVSNNTADAGLLINRK